MIEQKTQEWLEMRKGKIGASDAPIIMKKSPFKTPYELWREKLSFDEPQSNYAMDGGNIMEPIARKVLEDKLGMALFPKVKLHNERSWMMASLDALSFDERTVAEIKCPGKEDHTIALSGQVPEKYYAQVQHQIEVCEVEMAYYFSFQGDDGALVKVYRDEKYIKQLIIAEEKFYECLSNFEAPELMDRDYEHHTDARWYKLAERLKEIKALQAEEELIKKQLIELANGRNAMGAGIKIAKCMRKGAVEYSKVPELKDVDLEPYRKKSIEYWRFLDSK
jgi:putative phage-type endonuclease